MRIKILKILTVSVVTLAVISPAIVVFTVVWQRHIELVKTESLTAQLDKKMGENNTLASQEEVRNFYQYQAEITNYTRSVDQQMLGFTAQYQLAIILLWFFVLLPIFCGVGILVYDRYLVYRAELLKQQVEMLERLWQQGIEQ